MRTTRTLSTALALVVSLTVASTAYAEDPREQQAEPIYREGVRLHDKGQETEALAKFRQSYAVYPSPVALNAIARSELLLGHDLEAMRHFRQVLANPLTHPQTAQKARESVEQLEARLGRVKVQAPEGTVFLVDGERYVAPVAFAIDVKPGELRVEGTYGEARYEGSATAARGTTVALDLRRVISAPTAVEPPPEQDGTQPFWTTGHAVGLGVAGAGVLALGAGVAFALSARSDEQKIDALQSVTANGSACAAGSTVPQCIDLRSKEDAKDTHGAMARGFLVGGGLAVVTGAVLFVVWPKSSAARPARAMVVPMAAPHATGLELRASF